MCISIPIYSIYLQVMSNLHTHTHITVSFGGVMYFVLRGEGRRNWEGMEWIWIIWLYWKHLNLVFIDKYFIFNLNILAITADSHHMRNLFLQYFCFKALINNSILQLDKGLTKIHKNICIHIVNSITVQFTKAAYLI